MQIKANDPSLKSWVDVPAVPVAAADVVDTNGAGDAFFAGFVVARREGAGLQAAMEHAARHAAPMQPVAIPERLSV